MTYPEYDAMPVKSLARIAAELEETLAGQKAVARQAQQRVSDTENRLRYVRAVEAKKALAETAEPRVSDHALVRWLERVMGYDVEAVRASILTPERAEMIRMGATAIKANGVSLKVVDNTVVTILEG